MQTYTVSGILESIDLFPLVWWYQIKDGWNPVAHVRLKMPIQHYVLHCHIKRVLQPAYHSRLSNWESIDTFKPRNWETLAWSVSWQRYLMAPDLMRRRYSDFEGPWRYDLHVCVKVATRGLSLWDSFGNSVRHFDQMSSICIGTGSSQSIFTFCSRILPLWWQVRTTQACWMS